MLESWNVGMLESSEVGKLGPKKLESRKLQKSARKLESVCRFSSLQESLFLEGISV